MSNIKAKPTRRNNLKLIAPGKYNLRRKYKNARGETKILSKTFYATSWAQALEIRECLVRETLEEVKIECEYRSVRPWDTTPTIEMMTFRDLLPRYVIHLKETRARKRSTKRRVATLEKYAYCLDRVVAPILDHQIREVSLLDLQDWVIHWPETLQNKNGEPYATNTLNTYLNVLKQFLKFSYLQVGLPNIGCELEPFGVYERGADYSLSPEELADFLEAASRVIPQHFAMMVVGFTTGARFGSISALRTKHLDFEQELIVFEESQYWGHVSVGNKTHEVQVLPMLGPAKEALLTHLEQLRATKHPGRHSGLVFPAKIDPKKARCNGYMSRTTLDKAMRKVCEELGWERKITTRSFRQTVNTILIHGGQHPERVRSVLGHRSPQMTNIYNFPKAAQKRATMRPIMSVFEDKF